jgi:hypothetical protein
MIDAFDRAQELMLTKAGELPFLALALRQKMGRKLGGCGEVYLTAFAYYAQVIEGLECDDDMYQVGPADREWLLANKDTFNSFDEACRCTA